MNYDDDDKDPKWRSKRDRIARLRKRVDQFKSADINGVAPLLLAILDLLDDEL